MKQSAFHISLVLLVFLLAPLALAAEGTAEESGWEKRIEKEIAIIEVYLDDAEKGDRRAMAVLIRLADDEYINTAEGSEWLNEIYLDLMVRRPYRFLLIVSKEEDDIKERVFEELMNPVTGKYSFKTLKAAALRAKKKGLKGDLIEDLIEFYSQDD
jgi:hypothetical protein